MRTSLLALALVVSSISVVHSARILAVLPFPSKSHSIWHYSLFHLLTQRGHEVVVYGAYPPLNHESNVTYIPVDVRAKKSIENGTFEDFIKLTNPPVGFGAKFLLDMGYEVVEDTFKNLKIQELLKSKESFDLVIVEATIAQEALVVFGQKFKAPVINLQGFVVWSISNWVAGNPLSIAHIPDCLGSPFTNKMSFLERSENLLATVVTLLYYHFDHLPKNEKLIQTYYNGPKTPPLSDMLRDISLTLVNSHQTLEYPRPYSPNVVPIGGAHLSFHSTPLSQNVKLFMDEAKTGLIYFSLGTVVPADHLPKEYIQAFVKSFGKLSQRVLWKIKLDNIPGLPDNVMITKWVPQPTVLAHPNCVLFITHGGLFSQHEAFHAGVPVVAIPFFADQRYNVRLYESLGVGTGLEFTSLTEDSVTHAVTKVIEDKRYRDNAKRVSAIVRDKPVAPTESAVFWVEYVLRHRGAHHLRPASADLPWYQLLLLDVLAVVVAAAVLTTLILYQLMKSVIRFSSRLRINVTHSKKIN